jgi:fumarate hydratase subunit alpha
VRKNLEKFFVNKKILYEVLFNTLVKAAMDIPSDVKSTLEQHYFEEKNEIAKYHLEMILKNCKISGDTERLPCPDTGYPIFYIHLGNNVRIEGGFSELYETSKKVVQHATAAGFLRSNMVNPLTRENYGDNTGYLIPEVDIRFVSEIDFMEIAVVPKGGGGEIFGTFYRMMVPIDGLKGIIKFIFESIKEATYAGKTCPPNIIGIGIGGTADICMRIAKEAAILRPIGSRHPESQIADWEDELLETMEDSGIGPMGYAGSSGLLDVHMEYAACHAAGLPVAINIQCCLARRKTAKITADGIVYSDFLSRDYR